MNRQNWTTLGLIGLVTIAMAVGDTACAGQDNTKPESAQSQDVDLITRALKDYETGFNTMNLELIESACTEDCTMQGLPPAIILQAFFSNAPEGKLPFRIAFTDIKADITGSIAVVSATQTTIAAEDAKEKSKPVSFKFKQISKSWKISEAPLPFGKAKITVSATAKNQSPETKEIILDKLLGDPITGTEGLRVYYETPELKEPAEQISAVIAAQVPKIIMDKLGIKLNMSRLPLQLMWVPGDCTVIAKIPCLPIKIPKGMAKPLTNPDIRNFIYATIPHELTELELTTGYGISARWFTDGAAQYTAYTVSAKLSPATNDWLKKDWWKTEARNELLTWEYSENAEAKSKYGAALVFFLDLARDYGESIIPKIMNELKNTAGKKNSDDLCRIISKITGEDIKARLEKY